MPADDTDVEVVRFADRPDLAAGFWALTDLWPPFMLADPIGDLYFSRLAAYPDHVLLALGESLEESGEVEVPGALVPVHVDVAQDHVVYVEPNVWVAHPIREG